MADFDVQITEIMQGVFTVEADSWEEAVREAKKQYGNCDITLDVCNSNLETYFKPHVIDYPLPDLVDRYNLVSNYMQDQSDGNWYALVHAIEENMYGQ